MPDQENTTEIPQPVEPPVFFTPVPEETEEVEEVEPVYVEPEPEIVRPTKQKDELSDLFEVPQPEDNDMEIDDLFEVTDEDVMGGSADLSDLVEVSNEDIMGGSPKPKRVVRPARRFRRTPRRYIPPTSLGGIR